MPLGSLFVRPPKIQPYRPSKAILRDYEMRQAGDIRGLYSGRPYESPELGFSPVEMEAQFGERGAEFAGARAGEEQGIVDAFRRLGSRHLTGSRFKAMMGARQSDLARRAGHRRAMVVGQSQQRRADWQRRFGALTGAYQYGTGLYNVAQQMQYEADLRRRAQMAAAIDQIVSLGAAGGAGYLKGGKAGAGAGILDYMMG